MKKMCVNFNIFLIFFIFNFLRGNQERVEIFNIESSSEINMNSSELNQNANAIKLQFQDNSSMQNESIKVLIAQSIQQANLSEQQKKRKTFLRALLRSCGKILGTIAKEIIQQEAAHLIKQIPKIAERLLQKIDFQFKNIDSLELEDIDEDIFLFSEKVLALLKDKGLSIPDNLCYLNTLNSLKTENEKHIFVRKVSNFHDICIYEIFLMLAALIKKDNFNSINAKKIK